MIRKNINRSQEKMLMAVEDILYEEIFITQKDKEKLEFVIDQALLLNQEDKKCRQKLKEELVRAKVVDSKDIPQDTVTMNSIVSIKDIDTGEEEVYELGYSGHAGDRKNRISIFAPVGMGLLGCREGDEIEWEVPGGVRRIKVVEILYQPEAAGHYDL